MCDPINPLAPVDEDAHEPSSLLSGVELQMIIPRRFGLVENLLHPQSPHSIRDLPRQCIADTIP